jgi:hypothetical protein
MDFTGSSIDVNHVDLMKHIMVLFANVWSDTLEISMEHVLYLTSSQTVTTIRDMIAI